MFIKFTLTTNNKIIDLPNEVSNIEIKKIRVIGLSYKTGANTSNNVKLYISGFNDKYDIDTTDQYFLFMQLTGYPNTFHQYNVPADNKIDFVQTGVMRRINQLHVLATIDGLNSNIDGARPVVIELELC